MTPPALTMMPDDVVTLAWFDPLAVKVPVAAVTPFVKLPEPAATPPEAVKTPFGVH